MTQIRTYSLDEFIAGFHYLTHQIAASLPFSAAINQAIAEFEQKDYAQSLPILQQYRQHHWLIEFYFLLCHVQVCLNQPDNQSQLVNCAEEFLALYNHQPIPAILYESARCLMLADDSRAQVMVIRALSQNGFPLKFMRTIVQSIKELYFINQLIVAKKSLPLPDYDRHIRERAARISAGDKVLGSAQPTITQTQESIIEGILQRQWCLWAENKIAKPMLYNSYPAFYPKKRLKILLMGCRYQLGNEMDKPREMFDYMINLTAKRGHDYRVFYSDRCSVASKHHLLQYYGHNWRIIDGQKFISTPETKQQELQKLRAEIAEYRPDIVWYDYNNTMVDGDDTINPNDFVQLKNDFGFKLVRTVGDWQFFCLDITPQWAEVCDIIHSFVPNSPVMPQKNVDKFYFMPISKEHNIIQTKALGFGFMGSSSPSRQIYLEFVKHSIPSAKIFFDNPQKYDYGLFMAQCTMTFNSAYRGCMPGFNEHDDYFILTGRVFESLLNQTLLFEDYGYHLNMLLTPYIDFIPIQNRHELIIWVQFMIKNREWCDLIRMQGYRTVTEKYGNANFWAGLESRLGLGWDFQNIA